MADFKLVKQEVNSTVILPPLVFPAYNTQKCWSIYVHYWVILMPDITPCRAVLTKIEKKSLAWYGTLRVPRHSAL